MTDKQLSKWDVSLEVSGPITISGRSELIVMKGEQRPFLTNVRISRTRDGVRISLVAHARSPRGSRDAAAYFVGLALDVLGLRIDLPLHLNLLNPAFRSEVHSARRVVEKTEWINAFDRGQAYAIDRPTFSRALSWNRKGLTGENPLDQILAYWAALESIGSKYHEKNDRTKGKSVNQICNCFDQLWGTVGNWKVISDEASAVNQLNEYRSKIAHGGIRADVRELREISKHLPRYQKLARTFLLDWEERGREIEFAREHDSSPKVVD